MSRSKLGYFEFYWLPMQHENKTSNIQNWKTYTLYLNFNGCPGATGCADLYGLYRAVAPFSSFQS